MIGININCRDQPFIDQIVNHSKTIETRANHSLRPYLGQRVGLIETGNGRAMLRGFATITAEIHYTSVNHFRHDEPFHRVAAGSRYDFAGEKYGYKLENVTSCEPIAIYTRGIVARTIQEV